MRSPRSSAQLHKNAALKCLHGCGRTKKHPGDPPLCCPDVEALSPERCWTGPGASADHVGQEGHCAWEWLARSLSGLWGKASRLARGLWNPGTLLPDRKATSCSHQHLGPLNCQSSMTEPTPNWPQLCHRPRSVSPSRRRSCSWRALPGQWSIYRSSNRFFPPSELMQTSSLIVST